MTIDYLFNGKRENIRVDKSKSYTITPGFVQVLHTFGRDLKFNPHIHILLSEDGIDSRTNEFTNVNHFNYELLRKSWKKLIHDTLHQEIGKKFYPLKSKLFITKDNGFYVYGDAIMLDQKKTINQMICPKCNGIMIKEK